MVVAIGGGGCSGVVVTMVVAVVVLAEGILWCVVAVALLSSFSLR